MKISFLTLYQNELDGFFRRGVIDKAIQSGILSVNTIQLRDYSDPPHHKVDDYPFSNRKGMLLRFDVLQKALNDAPDDVTFIMPDPKGPKFSYKDARDLSQKSHIYFISPAYEGVDARIFDAFSIQSYSMGDFIVPNGDSSSVLMAEAVARYLPGVLGCADCLEDDSILSGLLEAPQFSSPRSIDQMHVPDVLLSGHHQEIDRWKLTQSLRQTLYARPDLMNQFSFDQTLVKMIDQIIMEDVE
ncbi:tRNA (guanosine(37)-N1)-methyltransferase TrmD [Candidatus Marinamargulisbacteria bacterium SCGC AG-343-K17]|nr:tRNA (guanosine(37)-N1)-methyltransferase TrmD [Candidatus Marinamargulisbacteria bacterium SCGC AG-343-K17]